MNKEREIFGIKIVVNGEQYEEYKGILQDQINELQDRIDSAINYAEEHNWGYAGIDEEHADKLINILKGE